jgi:calcium/calmodulin-dependent protein kinase I
MSLLMDYEESGTLYDLLSARNILTEHETKKVMRQLLIAVDFMHSKSIIHRDLKPDNILINSKQGGSFDIKISDFGLSATFHEKGFLVKRCGTPNYIAPEVFKDQGYTFKADIFSLGSIMFNLVVGRYLFDGGTREEML